MSVNRARARQRRRRKNNQERRRTLRNNAQAARVALSGGATSWLKDELQASLSRQLSSFVGDPVTKLTAQHVKKFLQDDLKKLLPVSASCVSTSVSSLGEVVAHVEVQASKTETEMLVFQLRTLV